MKEQAQKQFAGVWLDNRHATIITRPVDTAPGEYSVLEKVQSTVTQGGGSEHTMSNSIKTEQQKYFKTLSHLLVSYDEILIFGPGQSQEQFQNHLREDAQFKNKRIMIHSSDQLTDPQRIAKVRSFFKGR